MHENNTTYIAIAMLVLCGLFGTLYATPTQGTPILNSTYGTNYTYENLTCYNQSTQGATASVFDWRENSSSIMILNMPLNNNVSAATAGAISDYSSLNNNGTLGGASLPVWNASGKMGGAYTFDGTDDVITVPYTTSLDGNGTMTEFTLEAWIYPNINSSSGMIISRRETSGNASYNIGFDSVYKGKMFCNVYFGPLSTSGVAEAPASAAGNPNLTMGAWYYVACTYKNGTGVTLYVNASVASTNNTPYGNGAVRTVGTGGGFARVPLRVGARGNSGTNERFFTGVIDEVRVYNRSLSLAEITNHFNLGYSMLLSSELRNGSSYTCSVTPTDGVTDVAASISNAVVVINQPFASITINAPQNATYGNASVLINITSNGTAVWYQYNGTNYTYTTPVYRNYSDGGNALFVWANNSIGNTSAANVSFTVDTALPSITFVSPSNSTYANNSVLINISSSGVATWYEYNGTNYTYTASEYRNFSEGGNVLRAWSNNSGGAVSSASVSFTIDTVAPPIAIVSPQNATYADVTVLVNISSSGAVNIWFFNGTANETYTAPVYRTFPAGGNTLTAWANDSAGNVNSTSVSFTATTPNYNDVFFNSSFQSGNLYNVSFVSGNFTGTRVYSAQINYSFVTDNEYHWWFFFKMTNASGKNVIVNITNPAATDFTNSRWQNLRPRYSYDFGQGNVDNASADWSAGNWSAVFPDSIAYSSGSKWFSFNISAMQDTLWVAPNIPYTVLRRDRFLASIAGSPYVNISRLGTTSLGLNLSAVEVTDFDYPSANKKRVYIVGQQHANEETQGSWEIEGAINFLLNGTNATAATMRQNYRFKFIPILNVDGVYNGTGRFSPLYNGTTQWDPNREWSNARTGATTYNVVTWAYADIASFAPNATLDLHGSINGESPNIPPGTNYFLLDKANDVIMSAFTGNLSAQVAYVYSDKTRVTNSLAMPPNMYTGLGVHPSITFEFSVTNVTATMVPNYTDWQGYGTNILEGIHGFYNATGNSVPNVSLVSPVDGTSSTNNSFNFSCNVSGINKVLNVSFYMWNSTALWNASMQSADAGFANGTALNFSVQGVPVGNYTWNCLALDNLSGRAWAAANFSLNVTLFPPVPSQGTPVLNSTYGTNYTYENLTCYNQSTANSTSNTFDWLENNVSLTVLDMSFNTNASSTNAGSVQDYSTYANNGTLTGGATLPVWNASGKIGGAYTFDGTDDVITVPYTTSLDGNGTMTEFTLEAWIYPAINSSSGLIISRRETTGNASYNIGFDSTYKGKMFCNAYFGPTSTSGVAEAPASAAGNPNLTVGAWYYVACTYKNGTGVTLYVNASVAATNNTPYGNGAIRTVGTGGGVCDGAAEDWGEGQQWHQ